MSGDYPILTGPIDHNGHECWAEGVCADPAHVRRATGYRIDDTAPETRARVWTYRTRATLARDEGEARTLLLAEAFRLIPADAAHARILSMRRTPTGRYSALIRRERV